MASKRKSDKEGDSRNVEVPVQQSKRRHGDSEQIAIRTANGNLRFTLPVRDIVSSVEVLFRRVLRQELERQLYLSSPTVHQVGTFELRFTNKVASTIFTKSNIKSEEDNPVQIELVDATTQSVIKEGLLSFIKINIYVLKDEFGSKGMEDWTADQFDANILHQREGKEPLLKGETLIRLKNGVGTITNLMCTDNSRWTRSGKFRLGAKVAKTSSNEEIIREAISEPFKVKDSRGEEYKKHHPPSLYDYIWRLEKIAKTGNIYKRLSSDGIKTVKDLLQLYITNPSTLQEKFGKIPRKKWEAIIKHAKECVIDEYDYKLYIYPTDQQVRLLFNPIHMLVGVALNGQNYCSPDTLTATQDKDMVETVKQHAYKNLKDLTSIDEATTVSLLAQLAASPHQSLQQINFTSGFPTALQCQPENLAGLSPHLCELVHDTVPQSSYGRGDQFSSRATCIDGTGWTSTLAGSDQLPVAPPQYSLVQYELGNSIPSFTTNSGGDTSSRGTSKSMWFNILAALKCFL